MLKNFLLKKMLKSKLKGVPEAEQEKLFSAIEKKPQLFQSIAVEIQQKMKGGKNQMTATMEVMKIHSDELKSLMR